MSALKPRKNFSIRFRVYIISLIAGFFFAALALLIFSAAIWLLQLPIEYSDTFSMLSLGTGCLASGVVIGRIKKQRVLSSGFKAGLFMLLPLTLFALISGGFSGEYFFGRAVASAVCGMVGGVIGVNKKQ